MLRMRRVSYITSSQKPYSSAGLKINELYSSIKNHTHCITGIQSLQSRYANTGNLTFQPLLQSDSQLQRTQKTFDHWFWLTRKTAYKFCFCVCFILVLSFRCKWKGLDHKKTRIKKVRNKSVTEITTSL